jgi:hypothetical protein
MSRFSKSSCQCYYRKSALYMHLYVCLRVTNDLLTLMLYLDATAVITVKWLNIPAYYSESLGFISRLGDRLKFVCDLCLFFGPFPG